MKSLLVKFTHSRAIGVLIGERAITASLVAFTPIGPVEVDRCSRPVGDEPLDAAAAAAVAPLVRPKAWRAAPVAIGLPALRVFFSTRPIKSLNKDASPQVLLHEVLQSPNLVIDDMAVDMVRSQPFKQPLAGIIATRRKYLGPILEALEGCGVRPSRVEPAPFALLRAALARHRTPRRVKSALRVFVGSGEALAVLTADDLPLAWRSFPLPSGAEETAMVSAVSTLRSLSRYYGVDEPPELVMLHGRVDATRSRDASCSRDAVESPARRLLARRFAGPGLEDAAIAFGLALGCQQDVERFNLARASRPRGSLAGLVPWRQLVAQLGVLGMATMVLFQHEGDLGRRLADVRRRQEAHAWLAKQSVSDLGAERSRLAAQADTIRHYLDTRILWTDCARDVAERLPENMALAALEGHGVYVAPGKKPAPNGRQLNLRLEAPIPAGTTIPSEVDTLLGSMRGSPVLRKSLPAVKLSTLKWGQEEGTRRPIAMFSILCSPEEKAARKDEKAAPKSASSQGH
jgi:hypothetical protein